MGLRTTLGRLVAGTPAEGSEKAFRGDIALGMWMGDGRTIPITTKTAGAMGEEIYAILRHKKELRGSDEDMALAYLSCAPAFHAVDLRSRKVSKMPWGIFEKGTRNRVEKHPFYDAMRLSRQVWHKDLLYLWESARCIHGEVFMEKVSDQYQRPLTFRWLNPLSTEPYEQAGVIERFDYYDLSSGSPQTIQPEEMIYDFLHNPLDDLRGLPPMQTALPGVNIYLHSKLHTKSFFQNGARPGGILAAKQGTFIAQPDQTRLLAWFEKQLLGPAMAFKTIFMPAALEYQRVEEPPSPEHVALEESARMQIRESFGIPIHYSEGGTGVSGEGGEDGKRLYEDTIIPECMDIALKVNDEMLPFLDGGDDTVEFQFDFDQIRAMMDDQVKRATAVNARMLTGNITMNEARRAFGDGPLTGGDVLMIPKAQTAIQVSDLPRLDEILKEQQAAASQGSPAEGRVPAAGNGNRPTGSGGTQPAHGAKKSDDGDTPEDELLQWRKQALNRGVKKARSFKAYVMPVGIVEQVRGELYALPDDAEREMVKSLFDDAKDALKAIFDEGDLAGLVDRLESSGLEELLE